MTTDKANEKDFYDKSLQAIKDVKDKSLDVMDKSLEIINDHIKKQNWNFSFIF